ncbi:TadE/TadG family type IV pilus assembly protein [Lutimaribacter marinistellae]|uniref:TadE/TadG family type IV pilus assembly protein n=1 Tax=Lutimaribacter marinistellae TaxID=1820329 RepID=A0ABV7TL76_9RHOB
MLRKTVSNLFGRFRADESGSYSVEAAIVTPMLFMAIMAGYTYFDGYRQSASNLKAAYTIGDLISRETRTINNAYIDSMRDLMTLMVTSGDPVDIRVSLISWDEDNNRHHVLWSAPRGFPEALTDSNIGLFRDELPPMPDNDTLIVVETSNHYVPPFKVGIDPLRLENFIFTRPRFTSFIAGNVS